MSYSQGILMTAWPADMWLFFDATGRMYQWVDMEGVDLERGS